MSFFPLATFKLFSLYLVLSNVIMIRFSVVFFYIYTAWSLLSFLDLFVYSFHQMWTSCFFRCFFCLQFFSPSGTLETYINILTHLLLSHMLLWFPHPRPVFNLWFILDWFCCWVLKLLIFCGVKSVVLIKESAFFLSDTIFFKPLSSVFTKSFMFSLCLSSLNYLHIILVAF